MIDSAPRARPAVPVERSAIVGASRSLGSGPQTGTAVRLDGSDRPADDTAVLPDPYPETRYVEAEDGTHIGYQVFGDGPYDLVMNDGWMSSVDANWELPVIADWLSELGQRARVIAFDRRGFGI